jgi:Na+/proline symporter
LKGFLVVFVAIAYVSLLFAVASFGDRKAASIRGSRLRPYIYALSLAIYCTSWTFFGSVGLATERGLEFVAIYIGPLVVFAFGYPVLSRIVRLAKAEKITSIADFLGARYGKSFAVASTATLIATVGAVPYIALQLKAISGSVSLMVEHYTGAPPSFDPFVSDISLVVALLLALFAVLFGTRHADATEHQDGLVLAVAVESVIKLAAFLAVGLFVCFALFGGPSALVDELAQSPQVAAAMGYGTSLGTWIVMTVISGFAIVMLPRQFYMMIVENRGEAELRKATRIFPLYLIVINLFVLPIAFAGLIVVGNASNAAAVRGPEPAGDGRFHRWPVGCHRDGHRRKRRPRHHDLQRPDHSDLRAPPGGSAAGGRQRRLVGIDPQRAAGRDLRDPVCRLPVLP